MEVAVEVQIDMNRQTIAAIYLVSPWGSTFCPIQDDLPNEERMESIDELNE